MQGKRVYTSNRAKEIHGKRQKKKRVVRILIALTALIILGGIIYLFNVPALQIKNVSVSGTSVLKVEDIQKTAFDQMLGKYLLLIPKTNTLFYPRKHIMDALRDLYPRIKDLSVSRGNWNTLEVALTERESVYLWCGDHVPPAGNLANSCYFADEFGYIFGKAPRFSGIVYLEIFGALDREGLPAQAGSDVLGSHIVDTAGFQNTINFVESAKKINIKPYALVLLENGDRALLLNDRLRTDIQEILFKAGDAMTLFENLSSALLSEPLKTQFKQKFDKLLYIDLRYENKVYYKFSE